MDGIKKPGEATPPAGQSLEGPPPQPGQPAPPVQPQPQPGAQPAPQPPKPPGPPQSPPVAGASAGPAQPKAKSNKALWIGLVIIALLVGLGLGYMLG